MARHGYGRTVIDAFIVIPQRSAQCPNCGSTYCGPKEEVVCRGCQTKLKTANVNCDKKIPTGTWLVTTQRVGRPTKVSGGETSTP